MKRTTTLSVRCEMMSVLGHDTMYVASILPRMFLILTALHHPSQYSWFHIIFAIGAMYVAMLLTDWYVPYYSFIHLHLQLQETDERVATSNRNVMKTGGTTSEGEDVYIGRSETAMWMRIVSSWVCMLLYIWSLIAPVLMPDR